MLNVLIVLAVLTASAPVLADDQEYVSDEELSQEITSRRLDIARTTTRLEALNREELITVQELDYNHKEAERIERIVVARTKIFYRLHRNGGSLRYLLGSSSATQFLKRLSELKHLLVNGLDARRQAGLRLTEVDRRLATIREEKTSATQMLSMLKQALSELMNKNERRSNSGAKIALGSIEPEL